MRDCWEGPMEKTQEHSSKDKKIHICWDSLGPRTPQRKTKLRKKQVGGDGAEHQVSITLRHGDEIDHKLIIGHKSCGRVS